MKIIPAQDYIAYKIYSGLEPDRVSMAYLQYITQVLTVILDKFIEKFLVYYIPKSYLHGGYSFFKERPKKTEPHRFKGYKSWNFVNCGDYTMIGVFPRELDYAGKGGWSEVFYPESKDDDEWEDIEIESVVWEGEVQQIVRPTLIEESFWGFVILTFDVEQDYSRQAFFFLGNCNEYVGKLEKIIHCYGLDI